MGSGYPILRVPLYPSPPVQYTGNLRKHVFADKGTYLENPLNTHYRFCYIPMTGLFSYMAIFPIPTH